MRRLSLLLLASLQLCRARQPGFSIHDDMLAHPQFEVIFLDTYISESNAQRLIESSKSAQSTYTADISSQTDLTSQSHESAAANAPHDADPEDGMPEISEEYEVMNIPPSKYLCSVPVLAPPPAPNQTATELAKAEEARELARANTKGWELMSGLDNQCLFYVSGWWSYKFCYGKDIVQFHALPNGVKGGVPVRDPNSQEYNLGRVEPAPRPKKNAKKSKGHHELQAGADGQQKPVEDSSVAPPNTELQVKGDQRFLVQRMEGGTVCDLTGRERTIEVQYHCNPGSTGDRIGWIKEITTCSYLMLIHTPRLCEDVAFLPPKETRAHPINCQLILDSEDDVAAFRLRKSIEAAEALGVGQGQEEEGQSDETGKIHTQEQGGHKFRGMEIGGIVIGGKQLHNPEDGQPAPKLKPPKGFVSGKIGGGPITETLAKALSKAEGGKVEMLSEEELENMNLNPDAVEQFRKKLEEIAGEKGWTLEVVEMPGELPEIVGMIDDDEEDEKREGSEEKFFKEEL